MRSRFRFYEFVLIFSFFLRPKKPTTKSRYNKLTYCFQALIKNDALEAAAQPPAGVGGSVKLGLASEINYVYWVGGGDSVLRLNGFRFGTSFSLSNEKLLIFFLLHTNLLHH